MKHTKYLALLAIIAPFAFGIPVYATADFSASEQDVYVDDTFEVSLSINPVAAWNIHISANGPVDGCVLIDADVTPDAIDAEKVFSTECQAIDTGEITISLSGDYTTADGVTTVLSENLVVNANTKPETPANPTDPDNPIGSSDSNDPNLVSSSVDTHENVPNTGLFTNDGSSVLNTIILSCAISTGIVALVFVVLRIVRKSRSKRYII